MRRGILSPLRLPISPPGQARSEVRNYGTFMGMNYPTIEDAIGKTPLVALQRIAARENAERIKNKTAYILITLLFEGYLSDKFL